MLAGDVAGEVGAGHTGRDLEDLLDRVHIPADPYAVLPHSLRRDLGHPISQNSRIQLHRPAVEDEPVSHIQHRRSGF